MENTPTVAILTLALLTAPALAGGAVATSDEPSSAWHSTGRLTAVEPHAFPTSSPTDFGASVAADAGTAIVGAPHQNEIHVYERVGATWIPDDVLTGPDGFGASLAIDEGTIVAGAPGSSSVSVFEKDEAGWTLSSTLTVESSGCLGSSVAIESERIAAGDPCSSKSVYVYEPGDEGWDRIETLVAETDDRFGRSVDLSGTTLLVGGDALYTFDKLADGSWSQPALVTANGGPEVALSGDLATTGTADGVPIFQRTQGTWSEVARLQPQDLSPFSHVNERFSFALDLAEDTLVVSAARDDASPGLADGPHLGSSECVWLFVAGACVPQQPGAAYVFERADGEWTQVAKLAPEQTDGEDFSRAVAIDEGGETILASAPGHPHALRGFVDVEDAVYTFFRTSMEGAS